MTTEVPLCRAHKAAFTCRGDDKTLVYLWSVSEVIHKTSRCRWNLSNETVGMQKDKEEDHRNIFFTYIHSFLKMKL